MLFFQIYVNIHVFLVLIFVVIIYSENKKKSPLQSLKKNLFFSHNMLLDFCII